MGVYEEMLNSLQSLWNRIKHGEKSKEDKGPTLGEIRDSMVAELNAVKKLLRKQSLLVEEIQAGLRQEPAKEPPDPLDDQLIRLAAAFFHLDQSVRGQAGFSPQRREAFDLFWLHMEELLATRNIQVIRETGGRFDSRLHQAILTHAPDARNPRVIEVLQPGFMESGKVKKPAKVILGPSEENEQEAWGESIQ